MKLRATAQLIECAIDGEMLKFNKPASIELEFSAIDTGGGFKDPIVDFSFEIDPSDISKITIESKHEVYSKLRDSRSGTEITFSYEGGIQVTDNGALEINGRLKENKLNDQLIGFVIKQ